MSFHFTVLAVAILLLSTSNVTLLSEYGDAEVIGNKEKWFMFTEDEDKVTAESEKRRIEVARQLQQTYTAEGASAAG
jgi:hypothetical protein